MKVRMVLDTSAKPHPLANSFNECMYTGPTLQPLFLGHHDSSTNFNPSFVGGSKKRDFYRQGLTRKIVTHFDSYST